MDDTVLKVSVLADGSVLLDGNPVTLDGLAQAMDRGPKEGRVVWYYRENAAWQAPSVAFQVMELIADRRLRVRLSSKPRNVAVIGDTSWTMEQTPSLRGAARAIPFFGLLVVSGRLVMRCGAPVMRIPQILVHDRATHQLRKA